MPARDFINATLLTWLNEEADAPADGNKHYLRGFEDALKAVSHFVDQHRKEWDAPE